MEEREKNKIKNSITATLFLENSAVAMCLNFGVVSTWTTFFFFPFPFPFREYVCSVWIVALSVVMSQV